MSNRRKITFLVGALMLFVCVSACTQNGSAEQVTVTHGPVTPTATIPGGLDGIGTKRTFHAVVETDTGMLGYFDSIMTTTAVNTLDQTEIRITKIVVTLNGGADQLILEGTAVYPATGSTVKVASTVTRPVIGGPGAYAGARGWAESTRQADDTWIHVFHLQS